MLARSETINLPYGKPLNTPILLLSFSSKGFPELDKILEHLEEYISGPVLFSAYDIHYEKVPKRIPFSPELIFIDSGGYESSSITDFIEYDRYSYKPKKWNEKLYFGTAKSILKSKDNEHIPKVIINYDHPRRRRPIESQIESANSTFNKLSKIGTNFLKEIIMKPETNNKGGQYISVDHVVRNVKKLESFHIIGFTEKELGESLLKIMVNICRIRQALLSNKMRQLIHIFGSLDPVSTPLYFMCGADIFDGLTWLRYSFYEGITMYQQTYWFKKCPIESENFALRLRSFIENFSYLRDLYSEMRNFQKSGDFNKFKYNAELFKQTWGRVATHIRGGG